MAQPSLCAVPRCYKHSGADTIDPPARSPMILTFRDSTNSATAGYSNRDYWAKIFLPLNAVDYFVGMVVAAIILDEREKVRAVTVKEGV